MDPFKRWKNTANSSTTGGGGGEASSSGIRIPNSFASTSSQKIPITDLRSPRPFGKQSDTSFLLASSLPDHHGNIMTDSMEEYGENGDKAMFKGVRVSKYRHVYGMVARKDQCYDNICITKNAHDGNFCAVNPKFLAIVTESCGGGCFIVIPIEKAGRVDNNAGRVAGHRGQVSDIKWNPFNDNVIGSCSDDTTIKLWYIPDGEELSISRNLKQPIMELRGHKRRVSYIEWHPTADNILVSAGADHQLIVWNTATGFAVRNIRCHTDTIHSMSFNRDGSRLATTCKDKKLRIIDPRTEKVVNECFCHHGTKASKVVYLGDSGRLFTVGFSRYSDRQWAVWSEDDLSTPLTIENIDSSSGVLFPYYDHDTRMVYVAGKGDGNIRYYETTDENPYCHYLSQFLSGFPQRGLGVMPKRGCDVYKCELIRFYKLHATKSICEPISMIVPRKSEQFQSDVFPDTAAPTPALTADQWLSGQTRNPILFSLESGAGAKTNKPIFIKPFMPIKSATIYSERKFEFISQAGPVDYREKIQEIASAPPESPPEPEPVVKVHNNNTDDSVKPRRMPKKSQSTRFETVRQNFQPENVGPKKSESALAMNFRDSIGKSAAAAKNARSRLPWIKDNNNHQHQDDDEDGDDDEEYDENDNDNHHRHNYRHHHNNRRQRHFRHRRQTDEERFSMKQNENDGNVPMCDIDPVKHLPNPDEAFTTDMIINQPDGDSDDDSANTTDDSIAEELAFSGLNHSSDNNNSGNNGVGGESFQSITDNSPISDSSLKNCPLSDLIESHLSISPKNERELWTAFQELRALVHNLHNRLKDKDKRVLELENIIKNSNLHGNVGDDLKDYHHHHHQNGSNNNDNSNQTKTGIDL